MKYDLSCDCAFIAIVTMASSSVMFMVISYWNQWLEGTIFMTGGIIKNFSDSRNGIIFMMLLLRLPDDNKIPVTTKTS